MTKRTIDKLNEFFATLECDLEIGLAVALAHRFNCSYPEVFAQYEAWQAEGLD